MEGDEIRDSRITPWHDGHIVITLVARKVTLGGEFPPVFTYGIEVDVTGPKSSQYAGGMSYEPCQSATDVARVLAGIRIGISAIGGPHPILPVIDLNSGRPCPLPNV